MRLHIEDGWALDTSGSLPHLQEMLGQLRSKNEQLEETLEKVEKMAATDPLTELANRRHFRGLLDRSYQQARRYGYDSPRS